MYLHKSFQIAFSGGYLAGVYLDTSELIDPVAGSVSAGPTLQYGVYKQKTLKRPSDGLIFMATGKNQLAPGTYNHNTLMAYDFGTSQWTNYPDMVVGRLAPAFMMTRDEAKIVISGGKSSCGTTYCDEHSSEIFTFATNTWAPAAPLPDTSVQYSFANLEDTVFAMGNLDNHVYKYDIATDAWIQMTGVISNSVNFDSAIIYLGDTSLCG